jgi:hypothetical protein
VLAAGRDAGVAIAIRADGGADEPLATRAERSTLETSLAATPLLLGPVAGPCQSSLQMSR